MQWFPILVNCNDNGIGHGLGNVKWYGNTKSNNIYEIEWGTYNSKISVMSYKVWADN